METVNLWRPDQLDMISVARFPSHKQVTSHMPLGMRLPMYCTASGRAYLSACSAEVLESVLAQTNYVAYSSETDIDPGSIRSRVIVARERGFATAISEYYRGDISIAAPITSHEGNAVAAVNISVPVTRWNPQVAVEHFSQFVLETARVLSGTAAASAGDLKR